MPRVFFYVSFSRDRKSERVERRFKPQNPIHRDICAVLSGLAVAANYEVGQKMIKDRSFEDNAEYFATVFEIGRRHKILNPERMRTDYGKLIHLLMDSQSPEVQRLLEFQLVKRVSTVHEHLKQRNCLKLLEHPDAVIATTAITDHGMFLESKNGIPYKVFLRYLQDTT